MQMVAFHEYRLSRLMLGTVQFGLAYGIANKVGQPSYRAVCDILACAAEGGVNCLDTAAAYGTSEETLGRALADLGLADRMLIVTKVPRLPNASCSRAAIEKHIEQSVQTSLEHLRLEVLPVCLFHDENDWRYADVLLKLKERGLIRHAGCSVMTPAATRSIIASGQAEAIQLPVNLMDQRWRQAGIMPAAVQHGVPLFVRSVYLKGLLLLPEAEIPAVLAEAIPVRRRLQALAASLCMPFTEMAVRYVLGLEGITCALVGVDSADQMRENLELFSKNPLPPDVARQISELVPVLPDIILKPNLWPGA